MIGIRVSLSFLKLIINALLAADARLLGDDSIERNAMTRFTMLVHQVGGRDRLTDFIEWLIKKIPDEKQ